MVPLCPLEKPNPVSSHSNSLPFVSLLFKKPQLHPVSFQLVMLPWSDSGHQNSLSCCGWAGLPLRDAPGVKANCPLEREPEKVQCREMVCGRFWFWGQEKVNKGNKWKGDDKVTSKTVIISICLPLILLLPAFCACVLFRVSKRTVLRYSLNHICRGVTKGSGSSELHANAAVRASVGTLLIWREN